MPFDITMKPSETWGWTYKCMSFQSSIKGSNISFSWMQDPILRNKQDFIQCWEQLATLHIIVETIGSNVTYSIVIFIHTKSGIPSTLCIHSKKVRAAHQLASMLCHLDCDVIIEFLFVSIDDLVAQFLMRTWQSSKHL